MNIVVECISHEHWHPNFVISGFLSLTFSPEGNYLLPPTSASSIECCEQSLKKCVAEALAFLGRPNYSHSALQLQYISFIWSMFLCRSRWQANLSIFTDEKDFSKQYGR